jgi:hypothetical protein
MVAPRVDGAGCFEGTFEMDQVMDNEAITGV